MEQKKTKLHFDALNTRNKIILHFEALNFAKVVNYNVMTFPYQVLQRHTSFHTNKNDALFCFGNTSMYCLSF